MYIMTHQSAKLYISLVVRKQNCNHHDAQFFEMQIYCIHFFHWLTSAEGLPFVRCLEFNHKLGKLTDKYVITLSHFKGRDRGVQKPM